MSHADAQCAAYPPSCPGPLGTPSTSSKSPVGVLKRQWAVSHLQLSISHPPRAEGKGRGVPGGGVRQVKMLQVWRQSLIQGNSLSTTETWLLLLLLQQRCLIVVNKPSPVPAALGATGARMDANPIGYNSPTSKTHLISRKHRLRLHQHKWPKKETSGCGESARAERVSLSIHSWEWWKREESENEMLRHATAGAQHRSSVLHCGCCSGENNPLDPVSSLWFPAAAPDVQRDVCLERASRADTGMRRRVSGVRTAGGSRRRRELDGREEDTCGRCRWSLFTRTEGKSPYAMSFCLRRASVRGTGCWKICKLISEDTSDIKPLKQCFSSQVLNISVFNTDSIKWFILS